MYDYEPEVWAKMIENTITKHGKRLASLDFWVESLELYDRDGNVYSQVVPKMAVRFK